MDNYFEQVTIKNVNNQREPFQITISTEGCFVRIKAKYCGEEKTKVSKAVLAKFKHGMSGDTPIYAETYNMLAQTTGTLDKPRNLTKFSDVGHYRLPEEKGYFTAYNMLLLLNTPYMLFAYTSSERFVGKIHFNEYEIVLEQDLGGIIVQPQEEIRLEEIMIHTSEGKEELLELLGKRLSYNHPLLPFEPIPTGWCSWYCYGSQVTQDHIYKNLKAIKQSIPELKYIQIDDGYQAYMGDYFTLSEKFPEFLSLIKEIKEQGFEPAIWVAPFIAEADSNLLLEHPEYFVKGEDGKPLPSNTVTFGGWRRGPWYMLDGTHLGAREHLTKVFEVMREEWGIHYFKLDANMWGAMPFGIRDDESKTYVEAYRMGMKAILAGAGKDSYILGCNAPMWPSIGLVHGMRITGDISRKWSIFDVLAKECFYRNWQHKKLWINDPDCVVLDNIRRTLIGPDGVLRDTTTDITKEEFSYHCAHIIASGGALLAGDAIVELDNEQIEQIKKLLDLPDQAACFDDSTFTIGRQTRGEEQIITVFNREETMKQVEVDLKGIYEVKDYWDETVYGKDISYLTLRLEPHSARVIKLR